ncbi:hypothetical protein ABZ783_11070 [Micromonospora sp. NPDC047738]|uniref:hypothetical protein n=1 Tax=Micromonospora sp. NPDC047738 TaxID=3155741 RepID=UPI0033C193C2
MRRWTIDAGVVAVSGALTWLRLTSTAVAPDDRGADGVGYALWGAAQQLPATAQQGFSCSLPGRTPPACLLKGLRLLVAA